MHGVCTRGCVFDVVAKGAADEVQFLRGTHSLNAHAQDSTHVRNDHMLLSCGCVWVS